MTRAFLTALIVLPLAGCAELTVSRNISPKNDVSLGLGYRGSDDPCRRVGVTDLTEPYYNIEEDLVGCPIDFDGRPMFQIKTGGREVTRTEEWVIYRVPLLG